MSILADKVAIITGASSGIGEATAEMLGARNVRVAVAARRADRLRSLTRRIVARGGHAVAVDCDVTVLDQVRAMVEMTLKTFGRVDMLINNAGVMPLAPMSKCRFEDWDLTLDVNVRGVLYAIGCVLPTMLSQKTGHIVNISSVAGRKVFPGAAVYCASKFAVHTISEALRAELAEQSAQDGNAIRVSTVAPGVVRTELPDSITDADTRTAMQSYYDAIREPLTSEDVAAAIVVVLEAPPHVAINELLIRPTSQPR